MNFISLGIGFSFIFLFSGCLKTRQDLKEAEQRQVIQEQVTHIQQKNADSTARLSDIETSVRDLSGRLDTLDSQLKNSTQAEAESNRILMQNQENLSKRLDMIQEELSKLNQQRSQSSESKVAAGSTKSSAKQKDLQEGNDFYAAKEWKKAILALEKFRTENPKSRHFPEATFKIGVSFQELGLKSDAKIFFEELVEKYPKSSEASKAKTRLKGLR